MVVELLRLALRLWLSGFVGKRGMFVGLMIVGVLSEIFVGKVGLVEILFTEFYVFGLLFILIFRCLDLEFV